MGDMKAKVGAGTEGLEHIMGKHGHGLQNQNGELFVDLCARETVIESLGYHYIIILKNK
jgi:hypothetical protein